MRPATSSAVDESSSVPVRVWLDVVKPGFGAKFSSAFEAAGLDLLEDLAVSARVAESQVRALIAVETFLSGTRTGNTRACRRTTCTAAGVGLGLTLVASGNVWKDCFTTRMKTTSFVKSYLYLWLSHLH